MEAMKRTLTLAFGAALVAAVTAGCATPASTPASPSSSSSPASPSGTAVAGLPSLTITRTGGFAGVNQSLAITPGGAWTYTDKKSGATATGQFTPTQLTQFAQLALDPRIATELAQSPTSVCADAFDYELTVGTVKAAFEDCTQSRPAVQSLLAFLTDTTAL
jgi:hypothetical protein